jgi:hypothetical protein
MNQECPKTQARNLHVQQGHTIQIFKLSLFRHSDAPHAPFKPCSYI